MPSVDSSVPRLQPVVTDLLRLRAMTHPDRTPINVNGIASLTYAAWDRRSDAVAYALGGRGVGRGDRVMLLFGGLDWVDYAVAYFGVLKVGATAVHVNDREPAAELRRRLAETAAMGTVHGIMVTPPSDCTGWTATVRALDGPAWPVNTPIGLHDIADILYTSGTTGPAKAYANPHGNPSHGRGLASVTTFDSCAPMLVSMPLGTMVSANLVGIVALTSRNPMVVCAPDDVERLAVLIERHRIRSVMMSPWTATQLVRSDAHKQYDLTGVTTLRIAWAPMPSPVARGLLEMMPSATIQTVYALGEALPAMVHGGYDLDRPQCLGRPAPGTALRVSGLDGEPVQAGELGEVWLRSAAPTRLYLDRLLNEQAHLDGWIRTGDLGHIAEDGRFHLFDRGTDAIRTCGRLVSSIEVEEVLLAHPGVIEAAVFGVPDVDPDVGHIVVAAVVPGSQSSTVDSELLAAELRSFAAQHLTTHQRPAKVHMVRALPRGATGQVRKHLLRRQYPAPHSV